jgi:hypothetical protein
VPALQRFGPPLCASSRVSLAHPAFIELGDSKSAPSTTIRSNGGRSGRSGSRNEVQESGAWRGFGRLEKPPPVAPANTTTRINISRDVEQTFWRGDEDSDGYNNGFKGSGGRAESTRELVR